MSGTTTGYRRILVPLDGSLLSEYILPQVERFASAFQNEMTLLHVVSVKEADCQDLTPSQKQARAGIVRYLQGVEDCLRHWGGKVDWAIRCGNPADEIASFAQKNDIDLVIMSTHGKGEARHNGIGDLTSEVLKLVTVPVVTVRAPEPVARL